MELVYPQYCKTCDERLFDLENGFYCATCWEHVERILPPHCTLCGKPHTHMVGFVINDNFPCADCREKPNPHITAVRAATVYEGAVEDAVKLLTQSRLKGDVRHSNVRGAFAYIGDDLKGAGVLLIDDVVTTAGTVTECARVLKKAGAARVDLLAAAMAVPRVDLV